MKILVSACLLGENCKYNGGNNLSSWVLDFVNNREVIAVCPEKCLGVPRIPMEILDGMLVNMAGESVDAVMRASVQEILDLIKGEEIECAVLKSRSPTCGVKQVYDGSFSGKLVDGMGILAQALRDAGYQVIDCEDIEYGNEFGK